jgi:hypothetical protein
LYRTGTTRLAVNAVQNQPLAGPDRAYRQFSLPRLPAFLKNPHDIAELIETGVYKIGMRGRRDRLKELRNVIFLRAGKAGLNGDLKYLANPTNVIVVPVRHHNELDCRRSVDP